MTHKDLEVPELLRRMDRLIAEGAIVFVKWTCPACGERCIANEPNEYHEGGYRHEQKADGSGCGHVYTGTLFGFAVAFPIAPEGWSAIEGGLTP